MAGYIGSRASVVSSGAERKKTFDITGTTTVLTGLSYTPTFVHLFHNGVRLVDGTDYTATNGTSITLTTAAESGDQVVVVSYATFQAADAYTKAEADAGFVSDPNGAVTVDGSGNVGIGAASPSALLDVMSASNPSIKVRSNGGTVGNYAELTLQSYNNYSGSGQTFIRGVSSASGNSNTDLTFGTNSSGFGAPAERMRIDAAGRVTTPSQTSFIAAGSTGVSTYASGQPIVMNVQVSNVGGQYNNSNGYFTAPVAGLYSFNWSIYNYAGAQFCVIKNGLYYIPTGASDQLIFSIDGARAGGFSWHMHLEANDYVSVGFRSGSSGNVYCPHGQFSGYLIG